MGMQPEPRGVLDPREGGRWFDLSRRPPAPDLAEHVGHYWVVRWDVRGRDAYSQHVLPHPSVHLVAEAGSSRIVGVMTGRFTRVLRGRGRVFGIKFRPAGFRPFLGSPVSALTDRTVAVAEVFGPAGDALVERVLALEDESRMVEAAEAFVRSRLPAPDPNVPAVNRVVERIMTDREMTRVDDVVAATGLGKRRLQRLFASYVGVSPKRVIQRYRLHEAVERLAAGDDADLALLARELGYFDQAHFGKDFRALVGSPPTHYARGAGGRR
jgi:AraC-like DNA-binding protein